jgi:hypothetical protein
LIYNNLIGEKMGHRVEIKEFSQKDVWCKVGLEKTLKELVDQGFEVRGVGMETTTLNEDNESLRKTIKEIIVGCRETLRNPTSGRFSC